ncbi:MAG: hypothetical protein EXQ95_07250 [Alphaproteobacteria bacterium]|nr:hypothetical protein [Alphaproteobacteria bacterium]
MEIGFIDVVLVGAAFLVAYASAALGSTGGLLLAIMATTLPPSLVVPAHAVIEAARNGIGWARLRRAFNPQIVMAAGVGSLVAIGLVAPFVRIVPEHVQAMLLGVFLIWACWWPAPDPGPRFPYRLPLMGGLTGACSVFLGETGPLLRPFIADEPVDPALVPGSVTAVAAVQHGLKVAAFVAVGIDYLAVVPLLAPMLVAVVLGLALAERVALRLPARFLGLGIRLVVSVLALRLIVLATGWL